jgi:predicted metal-dependent RNase
MIKLRVLGGGREVGRSCYQLDIDNYHFLLDCGISPKSKGLSALPIIPDVNSIDAIFVSHAHLDHTGAIPNLVKNGFKNKVFMTLPTLALLKLLWQDELSIMEREWPQEERLWSSKEMNIVLAKLTETLTYHELYKFDSISINFHNAGHILGSSMIEISYNDFRIVYTGDLGTSSNHLRYWRTDDIAYPNVLICEGTYGGKNRKSKEEISKEFIECIKTTLERKGKILIPVFAVGKTQEILKILKDNWNKLPNVNVYLEGMSLDALDVYEQFMIYMADNIRRAFIFNNVNPFRWEALKQFKSLAERKEIYSKNEPCIIIAPSGMLRGGWSVWHMIRIAPIENNLITILGHMESGTIGYDLINNIREFKLKDMISNEEFNVKVNCEVKHFDISSHAMHSELCNYIARMKPEKLILIHGDYNSLNSIAENVKQHVNEIIIPSNGDIIDLQLTPRELELPITKDFSIILPQYTKIKIKYKGEIRYINSSDINSIINQP